MQHSPTAAVLSISFLLNHAPNSPKLDVLITRFRQSYSSMSMSRESKRLKKIKQQLVEFWQCTDVAVSYTGPAAASVGVH